MNLKLTLTSGVFAFGLTAAQVFAADVTMRITTQFPLKSHIGQNLLMFEKAVEEASNGAIDVEIYDSAQLYRDKEVPAAVGSGAIEAGVALLTRYVGDIPAVDIFYIPFMFNTDEKVRAAAAPGSPIRAPIDAAIKETGSTVLWWQAFGGAVLLSKDDPIKMPADMIGKKVRVFGKTLGDFVTAAGAAPTLISGSEQYLAYDRGTVDIGMTGVSSVKSRKLWEVMNTITVTNHADIEALVVVNTEWWNELSSEHQEIISKAAKAAEADVRDRIAEIESEAYDAAREAGMNVYSLTDEELLAWQKTSESVIENYKKNAGELGVALIKAAKGL